MQQSRVGTLSMLYNSNAKKKRTKGCFCFWRLKEQPFYSRLLMINVIVATLMYCTEVSGWRIIRWWPKTRPNLARLIDRRDRSMTVCVIWSKYKLSPPSRCSGVDDCESHLFSSPQLLTHRLFHLFSGSAFACSPPSSFLPSPPLVPHWLPSPWGGDKHGVRQVRRDTKTTQAEEAHSPAQVRSYNMCR